MKKIILKKVTNSKLAIYFSIIILIMFAIIINKSYAIYKLEQRFNLIESQIGTYKSGDYQVAVLVDGKETDTFPSYETNYKVESVDCTNGVTATFDVENWQLNIADMSSTSCKCTVSFNSKAKNSITPIAMSKTELLALNDDITNTTYEIMKTKLLNDTYPVGSIYMSTEDDTIEKVQDKFGGTWVRYAEGTMLISANNTYEVNSTGGSSTTSISFTPSGTIANYTGNTGSTTLTVNQIPSHTHSNVVVDSTTLNWGSTFAYGTSQNGLTSGGTASHGIRTGYTGGSQGHTHSMTHNHKFTGTSSTQSVTTISPYTATYMYKRTA